MLVRPVVETKSGPVEGLIEEFNDKASKSQKYLAIELMLNVASSDDKLAREEEQFINKVKESSTDKIRTKQGE